MIQVISILPNDGETSGVFNPITIKKGDRIKIKHNIEDGGGYNCLLYVDNVIVDSKGYGESLYCEYTIDERLSSILFDFYLEGPFA